MAKSNFKSVTAGVRTQRLAILLEDPDPDWLETCRRVMETISSLWGGHHTIIVPTDGRVIAQVFWDVLETFDPDYVCEYHKTGLDWKLGAPQRYQEFIERELFKRFGEGPHSADARDELDADFLTAPVISRPIEPALEAELKNRLAPFYYENHVLTVASLQAHAPSGYPLTRLSTLLPHSKLPATFTTVDAKVEGVPPLWVESVLGSTYEAQTRDLAQAGVSIQKLSIIDSDAAALFKLVMRTESRPDRDETVTTHTATVPIVEVLSTSPFRFSAVNLSHYHSTKLRRWDVPGIVVVGETLKDFSLFFNLSRMRSHVYWLLPDWTDAHQKFREEVNNTPERRPRRVSEAHATNFAQRILRGLTSSAFKRIAFLSLSADRSSLETTADELDRAVVVRFRDGPSIKDCADFPEDITKLLSEPEVVFNRDNFAIPSTQQIEEGAPIGSFPTPKPKGFSEIVPYEHRWITELRIEDHLYPRHPELGEWLLRHHLFSTQDVRSGSRGICYACPSSAYFGGDVDTILLRPKLFVPDGPALIEYLVSRVGWTSRTSDKGFYSSDTVAKFGNLEKAAHTLRHPAQSDVLNTYLAEGKSSTYGKYLSTDRRRYLDMPAFNSLVEDGAAAFVDDLIQKRVLHRGVILKCDFCRNADWFSVADVSDAFTCKRCRRRQAILSRHALHQPEPQWFYQLDEITYQGLRSNMHVPLLALDCLRRRSNSFLYCDELEISEPGAKKPFMEIDICCVHDGVLTIGEAKVTERIEGGGSKEVQSLQKYKNMAIKLGARRFVYATSKTWAAQTHANVASVFAGTAINTLPLEKDDLYS